ncbi:GGDEF domain-containing protein [Salibacterium salarium]|uniref:GGDEF domain-containing protein n=1 Tax=Salibacterium salarium TaxID=284579 RepID=A0A3R9QX44_9BACI|nr:GGDEF domain-containing protein [Salibacterium salarium]RSL35279.1 GGDEF domain-containing protein [Salibacterium salarium]
MVNSFIVNFSLLFTFSVVITYVLNISILHQQSLYKTRRVLLGIMVGATCLLLMINAYELSEQLLISFFHIPLAYAALYYSPWVSLPAAIVAAAGRFLFYNPYMSSLVGTLDILVMVTLIIGASIMIRKTFASFMTVTTIYTVQNVFIIYFLLDGGWVWSEGIFYIIASLATAFLFHYMVHLIQQYHLMNKLYEERARIDGLTGVYNRRELNQHLEYLTFKRHPFTLMLIDIDNFKTFNDEKGHQTGDEILVEAAGRIKESIREQGSVYRYGGEEFVVILVNDNQLSVPLLTESTRQRIKEDYIVTTTNEKLNITASIGVASCYDYEQSPKEILKMADEAMYKAKTSGKNRAVYA